MSLSPWIELRELGTALDRLSAEHRVTRTIGPYNRANELERQIGELAAQRDAIVGRVIDAVCGLVTTPALPVRAL